jgi:hypothetical protein
LGFEIPALSTNGVSFTAHFHPNGNREAAATGAEKKIRGFLHKQRYRFLSRELALGLLTRCEVCVLAVRAIR